MEAKAKEKALFRAKLRESARAREKRIDSPLVRYDECDQPVCKVCNVTLKSESLWPAHQVSRKHHEAIEKVRASASGFHDGDARKLEPAANLPQTRKESALPSDVYDKQVPKRQRSDKIDAQKDTLGESGFCDYQSRINEGSTYEYSSEGPSEFNIAVKKHDAHFAKFQGKNDNNPSPLIGDNSTNLDRSTIKNFKVALPENFFDHGNKNEDQVHHQVHESSEGVSNSDGSHRNSFETNQGNLPRRPDGAQARQVRGALPEGFFDNKDADLRARGIEPVKVDIVDAYKEFEKEIEEHLQEVDNRLEEEEIDAAVVSLEEFEALEQHEKREQADVLKKKVMEMKAIRLSKSGERSSKAAAEPDDEPDSSDESSSDEDDGLALDWRAQHL